MNNLKQILLLKRKIIFIHSKGERTYFLLYKFLVFSRISFTLSIPRIISAAFSAIIIVAALVFPDVTWRMTEASTTRKLFIPLTLKIRRLTS